MPPFLLKARELALDILFPPICSVCEKHLIGSEKEKVICFLCFSRIPIKDSLTCPECGSRFAENIKFCHQETSYRLSAASSYDSPLVKELIWKLKYEKKTFAANPLGEVLLKHLGLINLNLSSYLIIPMPLHRSRERERGFNQSQIIGDYISKKTRLPLIPNALLRAKNNKPQTETKDFEERKKNIENCFRIRRPELIKNKNILLVDDVFTSGATMNEAVRTLKENGAGRVIALVVAKAGF